MKAADVGYVLLLFTVACSGTRPAEIVRSDTVEAYDSQTHGAIQVMTAESNPSHWFDVLQEGRRAYPGNPRLLNNTVELLPGEYVVDVNRTQRTVTVQIGKKTVLWTGSLRVEGGPSGAYWYPMQGTERRVTSNPPLVNSALPLFPGTYTPFVHVSVTVANKNMGDVQVVAGRTTTLTH